MKKLITGAAIGLAFMASTASAAIPDSVKIAQLENEILQLQLDIQNMVDTLNKHQETFTLADAEFNEQGWANGGFVVAGYWVAALDNLYQIEKTKSETLQAALDVHEKTDKEAKKQILDLNAIIDAATATNAEMEALAAEYHRKWEDALEALANKQIELDGVYDNFVAATETALDFSNQIDELEADISALQTTVAKLTGDLHEVNLLLQTSETVNESIITQLNNLKTDHNNLKIESAADIAALNVTIDKLQADLDEWTDHIIVKHKGHGGLLKGKTDQYAPGTDNYYVHGQMYSVNVSDPNRYFRIYNSANPDLDPSDPDTQWGGFSGAYDITKGSGRVAYANIVHADAEVGSIIHIKSTQILKLKDGWIIPKHDNLPVSSSYSQYAINQYPGHSAIAEEVGYKGGWTTNSVGAFVWSSSDSNPSFNWRTKSSQSVRNMIMRIARGSYDTGFREGYNQGFEDGYNLGYLHGSQGQPHKDAK